VARSGEGVSQFLELGHVAKAHGLRGEVRVHLHWAESTALEDASELWLETPKGRTRYEVEGTRGSVKALLLKLRGVDDRTQAEALQGSVILAERSELEALEPGEYYLADLVGALVVAPDGEVGVVEGVELYPTADTLLIRTKDQQLLQQPLVEPWIEHVDVAAKRVLLRNREGLI
jgi:16S rRNA processing protein RimM